MKSCLLTHLHDEKNYKSLPGTGPSHFKLERELLKNYCGKSGQHWELKLALLVPGEYIFIFSFCLLICCIAEDFELLIKTLSKDIPTP